jgi:hypothetical protein
MDRAVCPYCYHALALDEQSPTRTVKCPACRHFFDTDTPLPSFFTASRRCEPIAPQTGPPSSPDTLLTQPYTCSRCLSELPFPTGLRRSTILCSSCGGKTSLYATLYLCPSGIHLLESPVSTAGQRATCPACQRKCLVPQADLVVRRRVPPEESRWYAFHCPCCHAHLETGREHAGKLAVCPECLHCLEVPYSGEALTPTPIDVAAVHVGESRILRTCSTCRLRIPTHAMHCPYCRARKARSGAHRYI